MGTPERSDHISTKSVLFKVGLKVPTPKHEVVAAEGTAITTYTLSVDLLTTTNAWSIVSQARQTYTTFLSGGFSKNTSSADVDSNVIIHMD